MKYIKLFENHSGYEDFVSGGTMEKPNVSHCVEENDVHYNQLKVGTITATFNVIDASNPTQLYLYNNNIGSFGVNMFDKVVIDGVEVSISDLDASGGTYLFSTAGEHTIKYTLKDPTLIGIEGDEQTHTITRLGATFMNCSCVESVEIPNSVITIATETFHLCNNLTSVTIPSSVTSIGTGAFDYCNNLTNITIPNSITSIGRNAFRNCTILSVTIPSSVTSIGDNAFCSTNLDAATQAKILAINSNGICEQQQAQPLN